MIFYRHPTPDAAPGLCYGRLDVGLGPGAPAEIAAAVAAPPAGAPRVISSPARRALALAEALADATGAPLSVDPRLQELDFGAWEGRRWDEIDRAESDPWAADPWAVAPPGGETFGALHARVAAALEQAGDGACLVTHAGPIRAARMILCGEDFAAVFAAPVPFAAPISMSAPNIAGAG